MLDEEVMLDELEDALERMQKVQRYLAIKTLEHPVMSSTYCLVDAFGEMRFSTSSKEDAEMLKLALGDHYGYLKVKSMEEFSG